MLRAEAERLRALQREREQLAAERNSLAAQLAEALGRAGRAEGQVAALAVSSGQMGAWHRAVWRAKGLQSRVL